MFIDVNVLCVLYILVTQLFLSIVQCYGCLHDRLITANISEQSEKHWFKDFLSNVVHYYYYYLLGFDTQSGIFLIMSLFSMPISSSYVDFLPHFGQQFIVYHVLTLDVPLEHRHSSVLSVHPCSCMFFWQWTSLSVNYMFSVLMYNRLGTTRFWLIRSLSSQWFFACLDKCCIVFLCMKINIWSSIYCNYT